MKKNILKSILISSFAFVSVLGISLSVLNAESNEAISTNETSLSETASSYSLEDMLKYAILDEYNAQATYQAIIDTYGNVRPFTNIVIAEQTHIDLLTDLFVAYGFTVPDNNAALTVTVPASISEAIAEGKEAETQNIAIYEAFLASDDLPDDVKAVFEALINASNKHLNAFSRNRLYGLGTDIANRIKNQFRKGNQYKGSRGNGGFGSGNQYIGSNANSGVCPNN